MAEILVGDPVLAFALRNADRCRNYGPEHERTENENTIVVLAEEVERLRAALKSIADGIYTEKGAEDWAKFVLRNKTALEKTHG